MTWIKQLLDNNYESSWKSIEPSKMDELYGDVLWYSYAPEKVLNSLHCTQLADSLRTWYYFREMQ